MLRVNLLEGSWEKFINGLIKEYESSGYVGINISRELVDIEKLRSFFQEEAARTRKTTKLQDFLYSFLPKNKRQKKIDKYIEHVWTPQGPFEEKIYPLRLKTGRRTKLYRVSILTEPDHEYHNNVIKIEPIGMTGSFYSGCDVAEMTIPVEEECYLPRKTSMHISSHCGKLFAPSIMRMLLKGGRGLYNSQSSETIYLQAANSIS